MKYATPILLLSLLLLSSCAGQPDVTDRTREQIDVILAADSVPEIRQKIAEAIKRGA